MFFLAYFLKRCWPHLHFALHKSRRDLLKKITGSSAHIRASCVFGTAQTLLYTLTVLSQSNATRLTRRWCAFGRVLLTNRALTPIQTRSCCLAWKAVPQDAVAYYKYGRSSRSAFTLSGNRYKPPKHLCLILFPHRCTQSALPINSDDITTSKSIRDLRTLT